MNLKLLLLIHAIITLAAGIALIVFPPAIPSTVGIQLKQEEYLFSYFLGAAELALAYLSFYSRRIKDNNSLKIIITTFIAFHMATALLEIYVLFKGLSFKIITNIIFRIIISALFYYYGFHRTKFNQT